MTDQWLRTEGLALARETLRTRKVLRLSTNYKEIMAEGESALLLKIEFLIKQTELA